MRCISVLPRRADEIRSSASETCRAPLPSPDVTQTVGLFRPAKRRPLSLLEFE